MAYAGVQVEICDRMPQGQRGSDWMGMGTSLGSLKGIKVAWPRAL